LIHLVDLDGARGGHIRTALVRDLAEAARPASLQASGGVRSLHDAEALLAAGAARVVVATAVCTDPALLARFAAALGDRLVVAVDVRAGSVAVRGWTDDTGLEATAFARRCAAAGVKRLLCTAIERDGMLGGPDVDLFREIRAASSLPVLAAGGIRSSADLDAVADAGCEAAIVGRALIDGSLPLDVLAA
jgi:phosphoribosylformimino-5-aminoimidazole carboxamide ribotide isomerase